MQGMEAVMNISCLYSHESATPYLITDSTQFLLSSNSSLTESTSERALPLVMGSCAHDQIGQGQQGQSVIRCLSSQKQVVFFSVGLDPRSIHLWHFCSLLRIICGGTIENENGTEDSRPKRGKDMF